jgi:transcriptional regulator with AAA-type ATPase domain
MSGAAVPTLFDALRDIVVADSKMLDVIAAARQVAQHNAAVLITGETGAGKEVIARIIHEQSARSGRPWVDLNCAALPEHLVESELFGYEKGAFSGAESVKPGLFELARGGTLFLDEIGDLDLRVQAKLLRVLDGMPYYRLGGSRKVAADVRLIAATNRNLETGVREGSFRRDLYHRISEVHLVVPPLRERPEDIVALARYFLQRQRPGSHFTAEALEVLLRCPWRGNVRELRNLVLKLAVLSPDAEITGHSILQVQDTDATAGAKDPTSEPATAVALPHIVPMHEMERQMIVRALVVTGGNQTRAAERLGIPRRTFCRKLQQFDIALERRRTSAARHSADAAPEHRKELSVPVRIITDGGRELPATARNLSLGGLGLQDLGAPLVRGEQLTAALTLPGEAHPFELRGVVAWSQANGTAGIRFAELGGAQRETLQRWIDGPRQSLQADAAASGKREAGAYANPRSGIRQLAASS